MYGTYQRELVRHTTHGLRGYNPAVIITDLAQRSTNQGIQGWSTQCPFDSYVIFCVGQDIVRQKAFMAWAAVQEIGFKALCGSYKGQSENSFIVNRKDLWSCERWFATQVLRTYGHALDDLTLVERLTQDLTDTSLTQEAAE